MKVYDIITTKQYKKEFFKFIKQHPELQKRYKKTIDQLYQDPFYPSLRLHKLGGKLSNLHSVSLNMQYRITLELEIRDHQIILISIGSHDQVY